MIIQEASPEEIRRTLKALTEIQEIDLELADIAEERGGLPEQVEALAAQIAEYEEYITAKEDERVRAEKTAGESGQRLASARDLLAKYQQQLYAVTTTREYDAITTEQETAKREISEFELLISTNSERAIELAQMVEDKRAELEQLRAEKVSREEELERKLKETEGEEKVLLDRRSGFAKDLNPRLLAHYERIRDAKDGRGIAVLVGEACGGCFALIPPQTQVVIRQTRDIYACEACGRFVAPAELD
ncbi:MAG: hypothetical protein H6506_02490 [Calditrichaeota bacterium]|nr:hypothetical protein [Calditrichota bacterium]MCB9391502.1 hypothetical protein [Calditrichota bacterium]